MQRSMEQLNAQQLGLLSIGLWTAVTIFITFYCIKKTIGLRVSPREEIRGLDLEEHGLESAYAGFNMETEMLSDDDQPVFEVKAPEVTIEQAVPASVIGDKSGIHKVVIVSGIDKFERLKKELEKIGIGGMTVSNVMGMGVQKGQPIYYKGAEVKSRLLPKMQAEVVVSKVPVDEVVKAAQQALYTGNIGDGKVFVYPVEDVVRISTGATGADALDYEQK